MADFNHTDYTEELNRIIVALTGIRDDIRLIRTLQEDCEAGLVTNGVMNDLERAIFAVTMSASSGGDAESVRNSVRGGAGSGTNGGYGAPAGESGAGTSLNEERTAILTALGQDTETTKTLIRVNGIYYFEPEPTAGPDDGLRGSIPQVTPYTQGELLGFDNEDTGVITQGPPPGPPNADPTARNKRWVAPRPAGQTALTNPDRNSDIQNPITGEVIPKSIDDIRAGVTRGDSPTPAIDPDAQGA